MTYFKFFSKYVTTTIDKKLVVVTDIFKRIGLGEQYKDISSLMIPYLVTDGETPELVSYKFYDTPDYHWVVLLMNGITNPRTEWPIANADIEKSVFAKYPFTVLVPNTSSYSVGDIVANGNDKFEVVKVTAETQLVELLSISGVVTLAANDVVVNETKDISGLVLSGIVSTPTTAIHHYFDNINEVIIDIDALVEEEGAFVNVYNSNAQNIVPVTNYEYEFALNDEKRTVNVLDSRYLGQFVRDYKNLLG